MLFLKRLNLLSALIASAAVSLVLAEDSPDVLEEVVVSGYRVTERQATNAGLSLLDARTIHAVAVAHMEELIPLVPNMNFSGEGSRARYLQLRGIGEREQYEGAPNPSVGFFIDDMDLSGMGGVGSVFDLERAEVLRGPRSDRFGSSALAGAVYLQSKMPGDRFDARAELTGGSDHLKAAGVAMGGPLSARLRGRISLHHQQSDNFRVNRFTQSATNRRDELTMRGRLAWNFAGEWAAVLSSLLADFDNGYDAWTVNNDATTHSDHPGRDQQQSRAGSLRLEGPVSGALRLVSISNFASSDVHFDFDGDWGNEDFWQQYGQYQYDYRYTNPKQRDTLGQELRLLSTPQSRLFEGKTDWVAGVFLNQLEEDNQISSTGLYDDSMEEDYCAPCLTDRQVSSRYKADTWAVFVSTDSELDDWWHLSFGLRFEHWSARYRDHWQDINYPQNPPGGDSCSQFDCDPADKLWGGHIDLAYQFNEQSRIYFRVARGFKSGGFNPSLAALQGVAALGPELLAYQPESLWNYEAGLKGRWLDNRLTADLSLFYMDRNDAQLSQSSQQVDFDPNSFVYVTYNGAASVRGLEASLAWELDEHWQLHAAVGLLDSEIQPTVASALISPAAVGRELAHAPGYTLNIGMSFQNEQGWSGRADLNAADRFYYDISHNEQADSRQIVNFRVGKAWNNWSLFAWVRNVFDETYFTRGFYFGNEPPEFGNTLYTKFGEPRSWGLTLNFAFAE